jgi:hypothetical protein
LIDLYSDGHPKAAARGATIVTGDPAADTVKVCGGRARGF